MIGHRKEWKILRFILEINLTFVTNDRKKPEKFEYISEYKLLGAIFEKTKKMYDAQQQWQTPKQEGEQVAEDYDKEDNSHRPPNAFILYSQAKRSEAQRQNPTLSNTEVSRILGKMWKEVPNEIKLQYKQKAAKLQEEFKKQHPDYTYRKARRKRALNELLTKSTHGYAGFPTPGPQDMAMYQQAMIQGAPVAMYPPVGIPQQMPNGFSPQGYIPYQMPMAQQQAAPMNSANPQQSGNGYY